MFLHGTHCSPIGFCGHVKGRKLVFLEIVKDQTQGRAHRAVRLAKGQREDWVRQRSLARLGFSVYATGRAYVTIGRRHRVIPLPRLAVWPRLYKWMVRA
jgi:hypothetical protein